MAARPDLTVMNSVSSATFRWQGSHSKVSPPIDLSKITNTAQVKALVSGTMRQVKEWCDAKIANLRGELLHLRCLAQRHRTCEDVEVAVAKYENANKALVRAIKVSKNRCWRQLITNLDKDTWGLSYRIALKRLRGSNPVAPIEPSFLEEVISCLLLKYPKRRWEEISVGEVLLLTLDELRLVVLETLGHKAPAPDWVPSEVLKVIAQKKKTFSWICLIYLYETDCLAIGEISKGLSFWTRRHIQTPLIGEVSLSDNQYGFQGGRSTVMALAEVHESVEEAWKPLHKTRRTYVLVTLDVRNTLNLAKWSAIIRVFRRQNVPDYLRQILDSCFQERVLQYDTKNGQRERWLTLEVTQGSTLGPDLWNLVYDDLLRLEIPTRVKLTGFANDIALHITARS
ncbi:uncharacterized protein LOC111643901 [Copidosoma floridanum]|uniref:uncharacterized protein LOC111643901 n=1 Tax=Copidosoma floridanum TaxID=29053 RepID=UPI000C6F85E8|nr:uncharacterized protein LOC111643901 [Copidosoma floridanum]